MSGYSNENQGTQNSNKNSPGVSGSGFTSKDTEKKQGASMGGKEDLNQKIENKGRSSTDSTERRDEDDEEDIKRPE